MEDMMNESTKAFTTALDCKHTQQNPESDDTCWECTMKIVDLTKAAEAQRDELAAQLATVTADNAALQERIAELASDMSDYRHVNAFERTAPIDWRPSEYEAETPLGNALEESG